MSKVRIEYKHQSEPLKEVSDLMSKLDLGIDSIWIHDTMEYTTDSKVDSDYTKRIKKYMKGRGIYISSITVELNHD